MTKPALRRKVKEIYTYDKDGKYVSIKNEERLQYKGIFGWTDLDTDYESVFVDRKDFEKALKNG